MKHIDVKAVSTDFEKRIEFLMDFVGFTDDDWAAISESVAVLGPHLPGILDALYDHLLSYDDTRRIFLGEGPDIDPNYIAVRKEHLTEWIMKTVEGGSLKQFANYIAGVGKRHTGVVGDPNRSVPPRYMVVLTSFVQTALVSTIIQNLPGEAEKATRLALAWNKMMMIQLEIFLKVLAPMWPEWDEPAD